MTPTLSPLATGLENAIELLESAVAELDAGRPATGLVWEALALVRAARRQVSVDGVP